MIDVGYIINTHTGYTKPLEMLVQSMAYIPTDRILIVMGGSRYNYEATVTFDRAYHIIHAQHDSYDYTGMIELVERRFDFTDHIFFLQDTMQIGMNTHYFISSRAHEKDFATAAFGGQCNLVLYRYDYLLAHSPFILSQKNMSKRDSIRYEGHLWKIAPDDRRAHYPFAACELHGHDYPYSEVQRAKEYYTAVDIVKWKANWGQNMHNLIGTP